MVSAPHCLKLVQHGFLNLRIARKFHLFISVGRGICLLQLCKNLDLLFLQYSQTSFAIDSSYQPFQELQTICSVLGRATAQKPNIHKIVKSFLYS